MNELNLITNRTAQDAALADELKKTPWPLMTEEQRRLWGENLKGTYNAADRNRVESAVEIVSETLSRLPYDLKALAEHLGVAWDRFFDVPYIEVRFETKTDWTDADEITAEQMRRYLANVTAIKNALPINSPPLPRTMDNLTWQGANAIEAAILEASKAAVKRQEETTQTIKNTAKGWFFSGEIFGGE